MDVKEMARLGGLARAAKYSKAERDKWSAKGGKHKRKKPRKPATT